MQVQRLRLALPVVFTSLLLVAWKSKSAQDTAMMAQNVAGPVHMVIGQGGNLGVSAGPDGVLLIDDQFANMAEKIQASLDGIAKEAGLDSGAPRFLINTHHHGDHTGGNLEFGKVATIIAHENVRSRLMQGMEALGLPTLTFAEGMSVHFNGEEIRLLHLPHGHTDGDTVVFFTSSNVVHMGDLFFNARFPFIDIDSGGTVSGYLANIQTVLAATDANTQFIPGHGELASRADLQKLHEVLSDVREVVMAAATEGMSAEEIKAADLFSEYESWGTGFISTSRLIDIILREMNQ